MESLMARSILFLMGVAIAVTGFGCGSRMSRSIGSSIPAGKSDPELGVYLEETLTESGGASIPLSEFKDRPLILLFASDLCGSCNEEIRELIAALKDPTVEPEKVRLQSILLGSDAIYAEKWKRKRQMPWSVAVDPGDALFRKSCPELQTPCVLVQLPGKGVVFQKVGIVPASDLQSMTGPWEERVP